MLILRIPRGGIPSRSPFRKGAGPLPSLRRIALLVLLAAVAPSVSGATEGGELETLARRENRVVIADFGLGLCRQCKAQSEILDRVKAVYRDKVLVRMVPVNREHELTARYQVELIPHLIFFSPSGTIALRNTGVMSYEDISVQLSRMGVTP